MKKIIDYILLYIIGNILFNLIFSLAEFIISFILSLKLNFGVILLKNITNNFAIFTIIFFIIIICMYLIDLSLINKLNKKLRGRKKNEE